jgi:hypothetical protein
VATFDERRTQLATMDPDAFEHLGHRVVRAAHPTAEKTGNPDSGADSLLPRADGPGWERAWQARRYGAKIQWKQCEEALDRAIADWGIDHYTFIFVADLSGPQLARFNDRLRIHHPDKKVDWWGLAELLAQLDETAEGRRVARYFLGETKEEVEGKWREAVGLGGELHYASDLLGRLRAMGAWLDRQDHVGFATHSWEGWQTEPPTADETFLSVLEIDEEGGRRTRLDAAARDTAPEDAPLAQLRVDFTPDEAGCRAADALGRAAAEGLAADLTSGVLFTWEVLPELLREYVGVTTTGRLELRPLRLEVPVWRAFIRAETEDEMEVVDLDLEPVELEGYEVAWRGRYAALQLTVALRRRPEGGGQTYLNAQFGLTTTHSVRDQLRAARLYAALKRPGVMVIGDREQPERTLRLTLEGREEPGDQLPGLIATLDNLVVIEDWTGERFSLPESLSAEEAGTIAAAAHGIRVGGFPASIVGDVLWPANEEARAALAEPSVLRFQQTFGFRLLGREVWLGYLDYAVRDYELIEDPEHPEHLRIRPLGEEGGEVAGRLHRGDPLTSPVPPPFTQVPGVGTGVPQRDEHLDERRAEETPGDGS